MLEKETSLLNLIYEAQNYIWNFWDKKSYGFKVSSVESIVAPTPTAECVIALYEADQIVKDPLFQKRKEKIKNYLLNTKWTDASGHYENVMAYSFVMTALKKLGCNTKNKRIRGGLQYLIKQQNMDGGWPFIKGKSSHPFFTFLALNTLLDYFSPRYKTKIQFCLNYFDKVIRDGVIKNHPCSYTICLLGLRKILTALGRADNKLEREIEEGIKSIKLAQKDDGSWNPEPPLVDLAKFRMVFFPVEIMLFLIEIDDYPFDRIYGRFLNWVKNNKRESGWPSKSEEDEVFSWTSAIVLLTLCRFYQKINNVSLISNFFSLKHKPSSFIAYASEDQDKAFILKEFLEELGIRATGMFNIDTQVGPIENILKQLGESDCLFAIYTKNTEKRPNAWQNVLGEYLAAKIINKVAILLLEETAELPSDAKYSCTYLQFKKGLPQLLFTQILKELKNKKLLLL